MVARKRHIITFFPDNNMLHDIARFLSFRMVGLKDFNIAIDTSATSTTLPSRSIWPLWRLIALNTRFRGGFHWVATDGAGNFMSYFEISKYSLETERFAFWRAIPLPFSFNLKGITTLSTFSNFYIHPGYYTITS